VKWLILLFVFIVACSGPPTESFDISCTADKDCAYGPAVMEDGCYEWNCRIIARNRVAIDTHAEWYGIKERFSYCDMKYGITSSEDEMNCYKQYPTSYAKCLDNKCTLVTAKDISECEYKGGALKELCESYFKGTLT